MKKKICFIVFLFCLFFLVSCMQPTDTVITNIYDLESSITETIEKVSESCIAVISKDPSGETLGTGSGVIYKKEDNLYYVVTNNHVVSSGVSFSVYVEQLIFKTEYDATLIGTDEDNDLAILTFTSSTEFSVSELSNVDVLKKGQFVIAIGTPLDLAFYNTATFGIISNFSLQYIQHDAAINPGNSGGALFNQQGRLIGINVAKRATVTTSTGEIAVEGIGFAIPISTVISSVSKMEENKTVIKRPVLGVTVTSFGGYRLNYGSLDDFDDSFIPDDLEEGIIVVSVTKDSVLDKAGVIEKDIILKLNGVYVSTSDLMKEELWKYNIGDEITITILRNKIEYTLNVTL